jgi:hypothetical protein
MFEFSVVAITKAGEKFEPYRGRDHSAANGAFDRATEGKRAKEVKLWRLTAEAGKVLRQWPTPVLSTTATVNA